MGKGVVEINAYLHISQCMQCSHSIDAHVSTICRPIKQVYISKTAVSIRMCDLQMKRV